MYLPQVGSIYYEGVGETSKMEFFEQLLSYVCTHYPDCFVIACSDFSARTGNLNADSLVAFEDVRQRDQY